MANQKPSSIKNLGITGILALTGCINVVIVFAALIIGLWLDNLLGRRGPATICLLVMSVPISLYFMVRISLALVRRIDPPAETHTVDVPTYREED